MKRRTALERKQRMLINKLRYENDPLNKIQLQQEYCPNYNDELKSKRILTARNKDASENMTPLISKEESKARKLYKKKKRTIVNNKDKKQVEPSMYEYKPSKGGVKLSKTLSLRKPVMFKDYNN